MDAKESLQTKTPLSAAIKIQRFFRNRQMRLKMLNEQLLLHRCSTNPILIGDENLYMYLQETETETETETEIPLFNIFNFKPQNGIDDIHFFDNFHKLLCEIDNIEYQHVFYIYKDKTTNNIHITGGVFEKWLHFGDLLYESLKTLYTEHFDSHFKKYILYILANSKINLDVLGEYEIYQLEIDHPYRSITFTGGIHKDYTYFSCLTYLFSPLTTELAFDLKNPHLNWISCSPLFRFDAKEKLYTLCFNDKYMVHTVPIYEKEGVDIRDLNNFKSPYNMARKNNQLHFGSSQEKPEVFLKQDYRQFVTPPEDRKILPSFFNIENIHASTTLSKILDSPPGVIEPNIVSFKAIVTPSELQNYKVDSEEEKIKLTPDAITSIVHNPSLGKIPFAGGRKKNTKTKRVKKSKKKNKSKRANKSKKRINQKG